MLKHLPESHETLLQEILNSWVHDRGSELLHHRTIQSYSYMQVQFQ